MANTPRLMREFSDDKPELIWHRVGQNNWRARWNHLEIGFYCDDPIRFPNGCYVGFGATVFTDHLATGAEARAAITTKFREWLSTAARYFDVVGPPMTDSERRIAELEAALDSAEQRLVTLNRDLADAIDKSARSH